MSGMAIGPIIELLDKVDFCQPCGLATYKMIVPAAQEESRLFAFTRPFQPLVLLSKIRTKI